MNEEELQNKIEVLIKTEKLRDYLLDCLKNECKLNSLNLLPFIIENALQRFEAKIKICQRIEIDLSDHLISPGDYLLLSGKLDTLRLNLAILYANANEIEITNEKSNYKQIKDFILKILSFKEIQLKLKYFDLTIKLLEKTIEDSQFNKEFMGALDLLKIFLNEPGYHPNEQDLEYIRNLGRETNGEDIRKCFYGIIHELDEKLLFQDLLKQLLKKIKNQDNSPILQFNIILITKCLNDPEMNNGDLNQLINLACHALNHYNELVITKKYYVISKIFNPNLIDLNDFKKDLKEKISSSIINNLVNNSTQEEEPYRVANILQGLDFVVYFPAYINNEKIKAKFSETKSDYSQILEKETTINERFTFRQLRGGLVKFSNKAHGIIENAKAMASDVKENLEKLVETSADRLAEVFKKNLETSYQEENPKIDMNLSASLNLAKEEISAIKKILDVWNALLTPNVETCENSRAHIETSQLDLNQCLELVNSFTVILNEKFTGFIQQILDEFKKINDTLQKDSWFAKPEIDKSSFFYQIFHRGYFSGNYTIEKIKDYLKNDLSFATVNNLISKQSFWGLLRFGIIRWPWINKIIFAQNWAEQFCLTDVIKEIEKVKRTLATDRDEEKILNEVIEISNQLLPYQSEIIQILENFKRNIIKDLRQLEILEKKIDSCLNEKEVSLFSSSPKPLEFFRCDKNCGFSSPTDLINVNALGLGQRAH